MVRQSVYMGAEQWDQLTMVKQSAYPKLGVPLRLSRNDVIRFSLMIMWGVPHDLTEEDKEKLKAVQSYLDEKRMSCQAEAKQDIETV